MRPSSDGSFSDRRAPVSDIYREKRTIDVLSVGFDQERPVVCLGQPDRRYVYEPGGKLLR